MKRLAAICSLLFLSASIASSNSNNPSPQDIINKMIAVYTNCSSYMDEGQVSILFKEKYGNRTAITPFSTAFVRPSEFRFEFKSRRGENEWDNYIISMKGNDIKTFWSIRPDKPSPPNLNSALATAAGVSSSSSLNIPGMMIPDMAGYNRFRLLKQLQLAGEEPLNDKIAYKIEGTDSRDNKVSLWIDKDTSLLLKVYEVRKINDFETETTTTYKPVVNVIVTDEKLAFNPTESK